MTEPVLIGTRVIEWGRRPSSAFCGKILSSLGAEVIKVEAPPAGDPSRHIGPFFPNRSYSESSAVFAYLNAGKLGIALEVAASSVAAEAFFRLVDTADILIFDLSAGGIPGFASDANQFSKRFLKKILVNVSPYGITGPKAAWSADDLTISQGGGEAITISDGIDDFSRPPVKTAGWLGYYDAGWAAATAVLTCLFSQQVTGATTGELIEISEFEVALTLNRMEIPWWPAEGKVETRENQPLRFNLLHCMDGLVDFSTPEDVPWERMKNLFGRVAGGWMDSPEYATRRDRDAHRLQLNQHLETWSRGITTADACAALQNCGVAVERVASVDDLLRSPQYEEREFWRELGDWLPGGKMPELPFLLDGERWRATGSAPPQLGEHTDRILLAEKLITAELLESLRSSGLA